jgi:hypothetical protein
MKSFTFICSIIPSFSWDKEGHDAVGGTAMSMLDSTASSRLKGILGGQDASDVAAWAHDVESTLGWTREIHFMRQAEDWACRIGDRTSSSLCPNGRCLEVAVRHFFRQLTRGDKEEGKNVMEDQSDLTDSDALRFLINLIGDSAQPLHMGFTSNNFGKNIYVKLPENIPVSAGEVVTLYDLWDHLLSYNIINNPYNPNFWWSGWTHVRNMNQQTVEKEEQRWREKGIESIVDWIQESVDLTCSRIYTDPSTGSKLTASLDSANPVEISITTYRLWEQALRERILLGGMRLGIVLRAILSNPNAPAAGKLRKGSAVAAGNSNNAIGNVFDDLDERAQGMHGKQPVAGYNAGLVNIGILIAFSVLIFTLIKIFGSGESPQALKVGKMNLVEMVGSHTKNIVDSHRD